MSLKWQPHNGVPAAVELTLWRCNLFFFPAFFSSEKYTLLHCSAGWHPSPALSSAAPLSFKSFFFPYMSVLAPGLLPASLPICPSYPRSNPHSLCSVHIYSSPLLYLLWCLSNPSSHISDPHCALTTNIPPPLALLVLVPHVLLPLDHKAVSTGRIFFF